MNCIPFSTPNDQSNSFFIVCRILLFNSKRETRKVDTNRYRKQNEMFTKQRAMVNVAVVSSFHDPTMSTHDGADEVCKCALL